MPANLAATLTLLRPGGRTFQVTSKGRSDPGKRRGSVRFAVSLTGRLNGRRCVLEDLSLTGARVRLTTPLAGQPSALAIDTLGQELTLRCSMCRRWTTEHGETVTLAFDPGQSPALSRLTALLFNAGVGLEEAPVEVGAEPGTASLAQA
jgi:hypothetical protein